MTAEKDLDARRREAASWFATLNQRRVAASDITAFSQWRRNPENAEAYARIETMWEAAGSLKGDADIAALTQGARARRRIASISRPGGQKCRSLGGDRHDRRARDRRRPMVQPTSVLRDGFGGAPGSGPG